MSIKEIAIPRKNINSDLLYQELTAALPGVVDSVAQAGDSIIVRLDAAATTEQITQARAIVQQHDHTAMTAEQQMLAERQETLRLMRAANTDPIDPTIADGEASVIQMLVKKVAWLEQEVLGFGGNEI